MPVGVRSLFPLDVCGRCLNMCSNKILLFHPGARLRTRGGPIIKYGQSHPVTLTPLIWLSSTLVFVAAANDPLSYTAVQRTGTCSDFLSREKSVN